MDLSPFICGVVEGFYGRPWSNAQRRHLFAWMKAWGMNTYLYAPKDDLKHRLFWREPYSESDSVELKGLIRECRRKELRFIYVIAPGLDLAYASRKDIVRLRRKADHLIDLGCRDFTLAFDDVAPVLSKEDAKTFATLAEAQSVVTNDFLKHARGQIPDASLCFCPTHYCERMSGPVRHSDYLKQLGQRLDSVIQILWTGPEIVSETIAVDSIRALQRVLRRKPLLWDNLHANDYDLRRIYLGPYSGRKLVVRDEVAGILSNPNWLRESGIRAARLGPPCKAGRSNGRRTNPAGFRARNWSCCATAFICPPNSARAPKRFSTIFYSCSARHRGAGALRAGGLKGLPRNSSVSSTK